MPANFDLIITADTPNLRAEFDLRDEHGNQLAYRQTEFKTIAAAQLHGLFNLRDYLRNYAVGTETEEVAALGVIIAEQVLGADIFKQLYAAQEPRTLRIELPGATEETNHLAAALARVPWEIARPSADKPTLNERGLLVRVVHERQETTPRPLTFQSDESLRVLFVFAEAPGSRPLAARLERRALRRLFRDDIYPTRRIEAHFLTHGVTRERLRGQIQEHGGYHIVHWSGHGHLNLLELAKQGGGRDHLSGEELLELFSGAGVPFPRLVFLSACHSGDILRVKDWNDFLAVAQGQDRVSSPTVREGSTTKDIQLDEQPGYTGTAHALLQGGVPSVVAMRYAVGDEYARDLALEFYRALLAFAQPRDAVAAMTTARNALLTAKEQNRYAACDHATPVLYGAAQPGLRWERGRSPALDEDARNVRLHQIAELKPEAHEHFVGRTWELAGLGADFIGSDEQPVAIVTGLGGMGKTALTAETLALWQSRFDWVLLYQAKPNALSLETMLRDIDLKLRGELGRYHDHVKARPADAIYRDASAEFTGAARYERMTTNLIRALRDEAILLVLDNFETNLKPNPEGETEGQRDGETAVDATSTGLSISPSLPLSVSPLWACQDANWDMCLTRLAEELKGMRSRVLITCRRPLAALQGKACTPVRLGPLPAGEAALYLREHPGLSRMIFSSEASERALAMRLLEASRFHPLLMDRLARLAVGGEALRGQLLAALDALEQRKDFAQLPELFAAQRGDAQELAYLNDALAASLDQFIADAGPDARRLLWMIAVANEPVTLGLLQSVWSGEETPQTQQLRQLKQMLEMLPLLPPELQEQLKEMPPELRAMLDNLPPPTTDHRPPITNLLRYLTAVGLVNEEREDADDQNPSLSCHELVRERIRARMEAQPQERDGMTENSIRLGYADQLIAAFKAFFTENTTAALQVGSRALVYCVQAEAYDRLGEFASSVVISSNDPRLLGALLPHLQAAAESAPAGRDRWSCLCYLADALRNGGRPDAGLPFYEQAEALARHAATSAAADSPDVRQAWSDVGVITGNWAIALRYVGNLDAAHQRRLEEAAAKKNAGRPAVNVIASELEALRIEIMQGQVAAALPQVETRLQQIEGWWRQLRAGQSVPEAPDPDFLARAYIGALDIATEAHYAQEDWPAALPRIDAILEVKRALQRPAEDLAGDRMNRANVLKNLGRFGEAQAELEACLQVFQHSPADSAKVLISLADLFDKQGDVAEAIRQQRRALALCERLPDPRDRAISHNNLANYLDRSGTPAALTEAPRHELAALLYRLVAGLGQSMQFSLGNYAVRFRRAQAAGTSYAVPRVAEVVAAFASLDEWLASRQVDVDELQAAVDDLLEQVRQSALS
ncbi:MAG: CHAT domain-containing protein [Acidobacteriota bacterium]|nr:CHAT domain-containing protein [Acidobacteriota bacterium]